MLLGLSINTYICLQKIVPYRAATVCYFAGTCPAIKSKLYHWENDNVLILSSILIK